MAEVEVYLEETPVRNIAKKVNQVGQVLKAVAKVLEVLSMTLKATAFIGLVGGYAVAQYIDQFRPQIEKMSEKCLEIAGEVEKAVAAYINQDQTLSGRFG